MRIVAVVNNKGGVGKTTVTANLGAGLAARGQKVLMIDLDPQASLTKSFFTVEESQAYLNSLQTIGAWFRASDKHRAQVLADIVFSPARCNSLVNKHGGWLDLVPSDPMIVNSESLIPGAVDGTGNIRPAKFVGLHRRLADDLTDPMFSKYDVVLVDCAPAFSLTTKMAAIASDMIVMPARPDYLSTEAIQVMGQHLLDLTRDFNHHRKAAPDEAPELRMPRVAVLFTMVQWYSGRPIDVHAQYINEVATLGVPVFRTLVRDRNREYAAAGRYGVPTILAGGVPPEVRTNLQDCVDELLTFFERLNP
ncbi:ParA family protein [Dactylosporangium matsuzakiense]|uniref:Cobyrinic acid a,c-diamide synthase n=1 Tax=Dactylosporangium matsuzakiense TaxID=53360 RepID=A0A9W6NPS0_9ACTN|nr:ParA family protein [Dactylosporangium matsuzakiense]UWZ42755.1 ParA family protein [Dactylosporangium matsuzakiense]GLL05410.1 cobyrinic acid a,c-diamide synthase [Dactylosporangium matsuzakiense]